MRLSLIGLVSSTVVAALVVAGGCGGDKKSDPLGEGGTSSEVGGDTSVGGTTTAASGGTTSTAQGGTTSSAGTSTTTAAAGKAPFACAKGKPTAPEIAPGTNGVWGTSSPVAGGTFLYQDVDASKFTTDTATTMGSVTLTANLAANAYAGYGIYFKDPEKCWDASAYTGGIRMVLSGDLGAAQLLFQVQTNNNYPIDTPNRKGACTGTWASGCGNNQFKVTAVTATPTPVDVPWTSLTGGSPIATIENGELLGIQWQINCPTDATANCAPTLTIGAVTFY